MKTPEGRVKDKVKAFLHSHKVQSLTHPIEGAVGFYWMPVVSGMGSPFLDFVGCYRTAFFTIETKAEGGEPTARQKLIMQMVVDAGGFVFGGTEVLLVALANFFDQLDALYERKHGGVQ